MVNLLLEKYFLTVFGTSFEKTTIEFNDAPKEKEIVEALNKYKGNSVKVEKRYVLVNENE